MTTPLLRIVFDTNVYISAALFGRRAETVLQLASGGKLILLISAPILSEIEEKLRDKFEWPESQIAIFLDTIGEITEMVHPQITLDVVPDDPDDNRIVECAVAGQADLIITFDKDLLRMKSYQMIGMITPRQLNFYALEDD